MRILFVLSVAALLALAMAAPASAGHPGEAAAAGSITASGNSLNMQLLANSPNDEVTTNSDLAFWGDLAYAGNYNGFRIIDISNPTDPAERVDYHCPGPQSDVGVWHSGDHDQRLLFTSVDSRQGTERCDSGPGNAAGGFEGIRIFDVTDPTSPSLITGVQTDCGSHTHTVVPARKTRDRPGNALDSYATDPDDPNVVLIYVSSYPLGPGLGHGDDPESAQNSECGVPDNPSGPHNVESIVEVPLSNPEGAKVVNQLELGPQTIGCHDVGVHLGADRAAAACLTEGQIWDISDPGDPKILKRIHNPDIEIWHSGTLTWDAKVAIFGDEESGATGPTHGCVNATLPTAPGSIWFYDVANPTLPVDSFTQRRGQLGELVCTAHNYNVVPARDMLVSSFYTAGTGVIDFTRPFDGVADPSDPREIGFYDAVSGDGGNTKDANTWSTYFYRGLEVANDIDRGVDIFEYTGSELDGVPELDHLNPQTQEDFAGQEPCSKNRGTGRGGGQKKGHCREG